MISEIGYQGRTPEEFYHKLETASVTHLFDVRLVCYSEFRPFNMEPLQNGCKERGIIYRHYSQFGTPSEIRAQYKKDKDIEALLAAFRQQTDIFIMFDQLIAWYRSPSKKPRHVALVCYERDWRKCHRSCLIEYASKHDIEVGHL